MTQYKSYYLAGSAAAALGVTPVTIRTWRDRGICQLGAIEEGAEDNPRSRRRYSIADICTMAIAIVLGRQGFSMDEAFNRATGMQDIREAIAAVVTETPAEDRILTTVGAACGDEGGSLWSNMVSLSLPEWKAHIATAFDATDWLDGTAGEYVQSVNVSAVARRTLAKLAARTIAGDEA
jgi:DNA-binding transcriptional MerR regulator